METEISMIEKVNFKRKINYFKLVVNHINPNHYYVNRKINNQFDFFTKLFENELKKNLFRIEEHTNSILNKNERTEFINILSLVETEIGKIDTSKIQHSNFIVFYNNAAFCSNCKKIVYPVKNITSAKKRIELHQSIIIERENFSQEMIDSLYLTKPDDTCILIKISTNFGAPNYLEEELTLDDILNLPWPVNNDKEQKKFEE